MNAAPSASKASLASDAAEVSAASTAVQVRDLGTIAMVLLQLVLVLLIIHMFQLESRTFFHVMVLGTVGFVVHALLPLQYRLSFFTLLSLVAIPVAVGLVDGIFLVCLGLLLIGICHLPSAETWALPQEESPSLALTSTVDRLVANCSRCVVTFLVLLWSVLPLNAQVPQKPPPTLSLSIHDDRLTVNIDRAPLAEVLAELGRQANLRVSLSESAGKHVISRAFRDLPLDEGIERLLVGHSHAVLYEDPPSPPGASNVKKIREIVVLSEDGAPSSELTDRATAREANPKTGADVDAMARVSAALQDPDPGVRLKGLEDWAQHPGGYSLEPLSQALVDPDESVRARAQQLFDHALTIQGGDATSPPPPAPPSGPEEMPKR